MAKHILEWRICTLPGMVEIDVERLGEGMGMGIDEIDSKWWRMICVLIIGRSRA